MILLAYATEAELAFLAPHPHVKRLATGIGPVDAAARVAAALAGGDFTAVVNAGIAGAMRGVARVGDGVVVGEEFVELALENGTPLALPSGIAVNDRAHSDPSIVAKLKARDFTSVRGVTVSRVTATDTTATRLRARGAEVESMEGFAVLRAAELAGVPAVEVRGISNLVGDRATSEWSFADGVRGLQRVLDATLDLLTTVAR